MATKALTTGDRASFALDKVLGAGKWIVISGTATFFLSELLKVMAQLSLPDWALMLSYLVINSLLFGIAKFSEGKDS